MPGVVMSPASAPLDIVEIDGEEYDQGGCANYLAEGREMLCGTGQQPFNTCLVKVEKWKGAPIQPGYKRTNMADKINKVEL
jgi:trimethylamine-N-oxide reductase (cytochrome c)